MAKRRRSDKVRTVGGNFWGGLAIGLVIAGSVLVYNRLSPAPAVKPAPAPDKAPPAVQPEPAKPRFDFYTILPELEVVVPEPRPAPDAPASTPRQVAKVNAAGTYVLQLGSFRNVRDADRLKAELALVGVEADIETVTVNRQKWHRVRAGPYSHLGLLNDTRARLAGNDIDFMLLKIKD